MKPLPEFRAGVTDDPKVFTRLNPVGVPQGGKYQVWRSDPEDRIPHVPRGPSGSAAESYSEKFIPSSLLDNAGRAVVISSNWILSLPAAEEEEKGRKEKA